MIVKVSIHRGKAIRFDQETGELFIYCNNQGSVHSHSLIRKEAENESK